MSYDKFKANVWSKAIELGLEPDLVFVKDCNRKHEGEVKDVGDLVTILGAGNVSVRTFTDGTHPKFDDPEEIEGTDVKMPINCVSDFHFMVKDIDKAQGAGQLLDIYTKQASQKLANEMDTAVANLAKDPLAVLHKAAAELITTDNVLGVLDNALKTLWKNNVKRNTYVSATVSPDFYMILKQKYQALDTSNSEMLKRGAVAMYGSMDIKLSNNVAKEGVADLIMVRTKDAISFANPLTKVEPYRNHSFMSDAVQGASLYGQKIVRPEQMIILNCKYA